MMFSATDFLPDSIRTLTNFATSTLPNFGSGRISRFGTSRRRGISIPFTLQLSCDTECICRSLADTHLKHPLTRPIRGRLTIRSVKHRAPKHHCGKLDYFLAAPAFARLAPYFERACLRSLTP